MAAEAPGSTCRRSDAFISSPTHERPSLSATPAMCVTPRQTRFLDGAVISAGVENSQIASPRRGPRQSPASTPLEDSYGNRTWP